LNLGCYSVVPSDTMLRKGFAFVTAFTIIIIIIFGYKEEIKETCLIENW
jgi:hypothetical protein